MLYENNKSDQNMNSHTTIKRILGGKVFNWSVTSYHNFQWPMHLFLGGQGIFKRCGCSWGVNHNVLVNLWGPKTATTKNAMNYCLILRLIAWWEWLRVSPCIFLLMFRCGLSLVGCTEQTLLSTHWGRCKGGIVQAQGFTTRYIEKLHWTNKHKFEF